MKTSNGLINEKQGERRFELWPWLITLLLLTVAIACVFTIVIALQNPDQRAEGDYRKAGLAIELNDSHDFKDQVLRQTKRKAVEGMP